MKSRTNLRIDTRRTQVDQKYAGDPESPSFLPPSPLIDRRVLPLKLEAELKRACTTVLSQEQTRDDDPQVVNSHLPVPKSRTHKYDKQSSFTFQPLKPYPSEVAAFSMIRSTSKLPSKVQAHRKQVRNKASEAVLFEPLQPTSTTRPVPIPKISAFEDKALNEIRSKLDSRPKTSAAACIDYTECPSSLQSISSASVPSHHTTYSTPFTSAEITPETVSKTLSQIVPNTVGTFETGAQATALPRLPDSSITLTSDTNHGARTPVIEQAEKSLRSPEPALYKSLSTNAPYEPNATGLPLTSDIYCPPVRPESIRNSIRNYIRPRSSTSSLRSCDTATSTRFRARQRFSALKTRISSSSLRSRITNQQLWGHDERDQSFTNLDNVDLDRPLPPLPGLDTYREKPKHISRMMKRCHLGSSSVNKPDAKQFVMSEPALEHTVTNKEHSQTRKDIPGLVLDQISTGSAGSAAMSTSPTGFIAVYRDGVRVGTVNTGGNKRTGTGTRPLTADSGSAAGAVPLFTDHYPGLSGQLLDGDAMAANQKTTKSSHSRNSRAVSGYVKKLLGGDRSGWGRKINEVPGI